MKPVFVRVRDARTGHHYSVTESEAANNEYLTVLGRPAVNRNGDTLPPKFSVPLGTEVTTSTEEPTAPDAPEATEATTFEAQEASA